MMFPDLVSRAVTRWPNRGDLKSACLPVFPVVGLPQLPDLFDCSVPEPLAPALPTASSPHISKIAIVIVAFIISSYQLLTPSTLQ